MNFAHHSSFWMFGSRIALGGVALAATLWLVPHTVRAQQADAADDPQSVEMTDAEPDSSGSAPETTGTAISELPQLPGTDADLIEPAEERSVTEETPQLPPKHAGWNFEERFQLKSFYDSNIFLSPKATADWISSFAPGISAGIGDYVDKTSSYASAGYTMNAEVFEDHSDQDSLDHDAFFDGKWQVDRIDFGLNVRYQTQTEADVDAAERVRSTVYSAKGSVVYDIGSRTSVESDFDFVRTGYAGLLSWDEYTWTNWGVYKIDGDLDESVGIAEGKIDVSDGPGQSYTQFLSRTRYNPFEKFSATLTAGVEWRQFDSDQGDRVDPVFGLDLKYDDQVRVFQISASRKTESSSVFSDQDRTLTEVTASVRQHLGHNWSAQLGAGLSQAEYQSTNGSGGDGRRDVYYSVKPSVIYEPNDRWNASLFVLYRHNDSNISAYRFDDIQAGVQLGILFN